MKTFKIDEHPIFKATLEAVLTNGGIAECKIEHKGNPVVVEINRTLKSKE